MDALRIDLVEFVQTEIFRPFEPRLQGLSDHVTSISWQTLKQLLRTRRKVPCKSNIQIFPRQRRRKGFAPIPHLQKPYVQAIGQIASCFQQTGMGMRFVRANPSIHRQRQRDQTVAEQTVPHPRDRKHPTDPPFATGYQKKAPVPQCPFDYSPPCRVVEEGPGRRTCHEPVPISFLSGLQFTDFHATRQIDRRTTGVVFRGYRKYLTHAILRSSIRYTGRRAGPRRRSRQFQSLEKAGDCEPPLLTLCGLWRKRGRSARPLHNWPPKVARQ